MIVIVVLVVLLFCDAPLPMLFRSFFDSDPPCFAFALEMTAGKDYRLAHDDTAPSVKAASSTSTLTPAASLPLLRFVLNKTQSVLPLTESSDWQLLRLAPELETEHV
jgi:hypothetical protein